MKTRTMTLALMATFSSGALFANNRSQIEPRINSVTMDTIPTDTIPKDTIPKTDTLHSAGTTGVFQVSPKSILKNNSGITDLMKAQTVYANLPSKESVSR